VYIAPLSKHLLATYGVANAFRILGVAFLVVATACAQFVKNPAAPANGAKAAVASTNDRTWREIIRTPSFWSLWLQYACAATAGLMIIGHMAKIVAVQSGNTIQIGFVLVALLACFNAGGRIVAGMVSDHIGRVVTIALVCTFQALAMFLFARITTVAGFVVGAAVVGFSYGACLSLFPSTAADRWGTKNLGLNYGVLFTAWGVGGVLGPTLAGKIADSTGSYAGAYMVSSALLCFAVLLAMFSYVNVSFDVPTKELTIRVGPTKKIEAA
jgi:MFS family permease